MYSNLQLQGKRETSGAQSQKLRDKAQEANDHIKVCKNGIKIKNIINGLQAI